MPRVTGGVRDLRCANTFAGTPPQAADFEYLVGSVCLEGFRMGGGGEPDYGFDPYDFNADGMVNPVDAILIYDATR